MTVAQSCNENAPKKANSEAQKYDNADDSFSCMLSTHTKKRRVPEGQQRRLVLIVLKRKNPAIRRGFPTWKVCVI